MRSRTRSRRRASGVVGGKALLSQYGKVYGDFHVPRKQTFGKVHGNFHVSFQWYCEKKKMYISMYQCTRAAQRNMKISVHPHCCIKVRGRHLMSTYHSEVPFLTLELRMRNTSYRKLWENVSLDRSMGCKHYAK